MKKFNSNILATLWLVPQLYLVFSISFSELSLVVFLNLKLRTHKSMIKRHKNLKQLSNQIQIKLEMLRMRIAPLQIWAHQIV